MQRSLRRPSAVQSYAQQLVRSYATGSKGSGRYPSLQEPGKPANPSVQTNPGNHAYPPTGDATASSADKSSASQTSNPDTSVNPANHAYPPTAGVSSAPKPSGSAKQSSGTSPSGADSNSAGSSTAYTPQGKDAKVNQAGSKSAAGSSSTPSTSSSSPSSSASASQGQPQSGNAPAKGPAAPAYKPMGASAPLNAEGASSSNPRPPTAGAAGNHAYPPTAGASPSSSGRGPPSGQPPSGLPPPEPLPGGRNKWRLHPYFPVDVRLLTAALVGASAYLYLNPSTSDQQQPNAGDGRIFGSPDSQEPDPKQLDNPEGEPIPLDMAAVSKHAKRLDQRSKSGGQEEEQEPQPNAGDGRVFGSSDSHEPVPRQHDGGEPLPFDDSAAAQHAKRLAQRAQQPQPSADDGRVFGSPESQEPNPEQLDNGEPLPLDNSAVAKHAKRLAQHSQQHQPSNDDEQHQPSPGDGRVMGSEQSREPAPEQQADGEPLPLDLDAVDKHQQRLEAAARQREQQGSQHQPRVGDGRKMGTPDSVEPEPVELLNGEQHQPRVGDGRKMGLPDSKEPKPVVLDNGEPMPVDAEAVAKHQRRLDDRTKQRQARHENAHSDEFAISGDQEGDKACSSQKGTKGDGKGGKDEKPVYVDATPLAALFQEALGGAPGPAPAQTDQLRQSHTSDELNADKAKASARDGAESAANKAEEAKGAAKDRGESAARETKGAARSAGQKAEEAKDSAKSGAEAVANKADNVKDSARSGGQSVADSAKDAVNSAKQKAEDVKDSAQLSTESAADSAKAGVRSAGENAEEVKGSVKSGAADARQKAEEVSGSAQSASESAADRTQDGVRSAKRKAEDAKDSAQSGGESAADSAKAGVKSAKQKAEEAKSSAQSGAESAKGGAEEVRDSAKSGAQSLRQKAGNAKDSAKSQVASIADSAKDVVSSAGKKSEDVKHSAKSSAESARQKAEEAKDSAKSGTESAKGKAQEAKDSVKSSAESARQKAEDVKDSAKSGAESAGDEAKEAKDAVKSGSESAGQKAGEVADSAKAKVESTARDSAAAAEGAAAKSKRKGRKAMDEAMHVVTESMNDTGGLGYFHEKTNKVKDDAALEEEVEQQPTDEQATQTAVAGLQHMTESHGPAAQLPSRPILGVSEDLSGASLVRKAIEGGQGSGDDWAEFKYRHRQAEQDSQLLYATLQRAEQFHQAEVDRLEQLVHAEAARADYILDAAQDNIDAFAQTLDQQTRRHQRRYQSSLQRQRQVLAQAAAQELVRERKQRMTTLIEIRKKLRSLQGLLQFRGNEQEISHTAHKLSVGAFALQSALDKGAPFESELEYLAEGCQGDPLVQTAVLSFKQQTALKGIPTRAQLLDRWAGVSRAARQLSAIPQGQGGPLSIAVASLASALKIREGPSGAGPEGLSAGGLETHLAYAESCLINGQLSTAAAHVQKLVQGSEAAPLVQDWVKAAQSRAVAEQTSALLQAHAATLAASLSQA